MSESIEILLDTEELVVVGPPDVINVAFDIGQTGKRGSMWFSGSGMPGRNVIDYNDLQENDMYVNTDDGNIFQYILTPSNVLDWTQIGNLNGGGSTVVASTTPPSDTSAVWIDTTGL